MRVPYEAVLDESSGRCVLSVAGEVERGDIYRFDVALDELVAGGGGVVDLTGVSYLPSAAVAPLAGAVQRARRAGTPLEVRAERHSIADRVLHSVGIPHDDGSDDPPDPLA